MGCKKQYSSKLDEALEPSAVRVIFAVLSSHVQPASMSHRALEPCAVGWRT